jgi:hypothetical protein
LLALGMIIPKQKPRQIKQKRFHCSMLIQERMIEAVPIFLKFYGPIWQIQEWKVLTFSVTTKKINYY